MGIWDNFYCIEELSDDEVNEKIALYLKEPICNYCEDWEQTQRFINMFEDLNMTIEVSKMGKTFDWHVEVYDDDPRTAWIDFDAVQKQKKLTAAVARCALEWFMFQEKE